MPLQSRLLQGRGVLVTRPTHQSAQLISAIENAGGTAYPFPTIEILPPHDLQSALERIAEINNYDILIFISANAARIGLELISQQASIPTHIQVAAVGKATATTLENAGVTVNILPQQRFDSEGLLATVALQTVTNKRILIFRGEGGRELLATTLRNRGATVDYAEAYRRSIPDINPTPLLQAWQEKRIDAAVVTSNQSLDNLIQMVGESGREPLLHTLLIVISERTREVARERGFIHEPLLTNSPSDQAILDTLYNHYSDNNR